MKYLGHLCSRADLHDEAGGQDDFPAATALGIAADLNVRGEE
jgi:hypothetical protein